MTRRRVVVTGLGVVAANAIGKDDFAEAMFFGKSGVRAVIQANERSGCFVEARVSDSRVKTDGRIRPQHAARVSEFAVTVASMAVRDAGIDLQALPKCRIGLCYGTTTGKPDFDEDASRFAEGGVAALAGDAWAEFSPHAPASHIAKELKLTGPIATSSAGCCTGLTVMDWAARGIAAGKLDVALVGSGDSLLSPLTVAAFSAGGLLTKNSDPTTACRPFDLYRDGLVPGEGAGALVLESLDSARARDATIYSEFLGYGSAVDSTRVADRARSGEGLARAIQEALGDARLTSASIDCINSHGLSHPLFDRIETDGFRVALGKAAYGMPITSIKSLTGACFAGDGILQLISSCLILQAGKVPAIVGLETSDPSCDLDYVKKNVRTARVNAILTNTRALGGANSVVILGRPD